jgi:hypothetical protein
VPPRHRGVVQHDVRLGRTSDEQPLLNWRRPIKTQQAHRPATDPQPDSSAQPPAGRKSSARRAQREIVDQGARIDSYLTQNAVEPRQERALTQQPFTVGGAKRPIQLPTTRARLHGSILLHRRPSANLTPSASLFLRAALKAGADLDRREILVDLLDEREESPPGFACCDRHHNPFRAREVLVKFQSTRDAPSRRGTQRRAANGSVCWRVLPHLRTRAARQMRVPTTGCTALRLTISHVSAAEPFPPEPSPRAVSLRRTVWGCRVVASSSIT